MVLLRGGKKPITQFKGQYGIKGKMLLNSYSTAISVSFETNWSVTSQTQKIYNVLHRKMLRKQSQIVHENYLLLMSWCSLLTIMHLP